MTQDEVLKEQQSPYRSTMEALRQAEESLPDFSSSYDDEIRSLYERIVGRGAFRYDAGTDPLYRDYRDRYAAEGRMAMRDTIGQAAQLTGGYGSSYAEGVGQQQYGAYLQKLGEIMPELYSAAYERWKGEGERLGDQFNMAVKLEKTEYGRAQDKRKAAAELEQKDYDRLQAAYKNLKELIAGSGYEPADAELSAVGMSREQAEALRTEYLRARKLLPAQGGGAGGGRVYTARSSSTRSSGTRRTAEPKKQFDEYAKVYGPGSK